MSSAYVKMEIDGNLADFGTAIEALFGRQAGFKAPVENVENGATVCYGTGKVKVPVAEGDTVGGLYAKAATRLGMEAGRSLTFQAGGRIVAGSDPAEVGAEYLAVPNHDPKG